MKLRNGLILIFVLSLIACGRNKSNKEKINIDNLLEEGLQANNLEISTESMNSIIESIPSPIEVANVIMLSGTSFNEGLINPQENAQLFSTDQEKALNIGIYSGDLGYINIYEKSYLTVNYLNTISNLAGDINIGQFFDFTTIKRMASNTDKMDSLIYISTSNFNKMDAFLRGQKRSNLSILMITGTWTEGLYIATQIFKENNSNEIKEWIGYQKIIVDQLLLGLSAYKNDKYFQKVISHLNSLKNIYDTISITYEYHEPEAIEENGRLVIIDKSSSTVNITPDQVLQIGAIIEQIRTSLTKNN